VRRTYGGDFGISLSSDVGFLARDLARAADLGPREMKRAVREFGDRVVSRSRHNVSGNWYRPLNATLFGQRTGFPFTASDASSQAAGLALVPQSEAFLSLRTGDLRSSLDPEIHETKHGIRYRMMSQVKYGWWWEEGWTEIHGPYPAGYLGGELQFIQGTGRKRWRPWFTEAWIGEGGESEALLELQQAVVPLMVGGP